MRLEGMEWRVPDEDYAPDGCWLRNESETSFHVFYLFEAEDIEYTKLFPNEILPFYRPLKLVADGNIPVEAVHDAMHMAENLAKELDRCE